MRNGRHEAWREYERGALWVLPGASMIAALVLGALQRPCTARLVADLGRQYLAAPRRPVTAEDISGAGSRCCR
jgi:hypothetical protein